MIFVASHRECGWLLVAAPHSREGKESEIKFIQFSFQLQAFIYFFVNLVGHAESFWRAQEAADFFVNKFVFVN